MNGKKDNFSPIFNFEGGFLRNRIGAYTLGYKISYRDIFSLSKDNYVDIIELWKKVFDLLPDWSVVHKQDYYVREIYKPARNENLDMDMFEDSYFKKFFEWPYLNNACYLYISKTDSKLFKRDSVSTTILKGSIVPKNLIDPDIEKEFVRGVDAAINILKKSAYFEISKLKEDDIFSSETSVGLLERYNFLNFSNKTYTADVSDADDAIRVGNKYVNFYAINDLDALPSSYQSSYREPVYHTENSDIDFSLLYPIGLGIAHDHIVNQIFYKTNKDHVITMLERDNKGFTSFVGGEKNGVHYQYNLNYINTSIEHMHTPIYAHINVMVWYENKENLKQIEGDIFEAFNRISFSPNVVTSNAMNLFYGCYPGNASDFPFKDETMLLHDVQAAALTINEGTSQTNVSEFGLRVSDRLSGKPLYLDISDTPMKKGIIVNRNKVVFGPSGSGKSFATNNLVNSYIRTGAHVLIVDVGDSYERQCEFYNGKYFKYEKENPISFNPFVVENNDPEEEKIQSLINLILTLWKKSPDEHNKLEGTILSDIVIDYYAYLRKNDNILPCFNTFYEYTTVVFFDKINKTEGLSEKFDMLDFKVVLKPYFKGGNYDYLLNANKNLDLFNEKFLVFELDNIKDNKVLFPVVTLIIMDTFITKMLNIKGCRKVIIIEEAWKAIANETMAGFIKYLYKTCRKHFGETIMVTQEVDDLVGNEIVKDTVISQSGCKILLDMKEYKNRFKEIQNILGLTNDAKDSILSINKNLNPNFGKYKEMFVALGDTYNVYSVMLSKEEYAMYTTEKLEKERINIYREQTGSLQLALKQFAKDMDNPTKLN